MLAQGGWQLTDSAPQGIFLSYRRQDAAPYARLLHFQLRERFPAARVFMDLDSIEAGLDFADVIGQAVDSCTVLVALIGRQWTTLTDEAGQRRLDDPDDFVRFEVQAALDREVRVIPVLVDGATPLRLQQLPSELHKLARLNALELSYGRYEYDAERLIELIERVLAEAPGAPDPTVQTAEGAGGKAAQRNLEAARDPRQAARLLTEAEGIAYSLPDEWEKAAATKAAALSGVADVLAATDPDRAARLFTDAERICQSLRDEGHEELVKVGQALAAFDPDRAERFADSLVDDQLDYPEYKKLAVLHGVATVLAPTETDRAERLARSNDGDWVVEGLADVAGALAATDLDRAESIAHSFNSQPYYEITVLLGIAKGLAATDPGHAVQVLSEAEKIARSSFPVDDSFYVEYLSAVAQALAPIDLDGAERLARSIPDEAWEAWALAEIAAVLAATDPDRAEHIVHSLTWEYAKVAALHKVARAVAATDADRAERLAGSIPDQEKRAAALSDVAQALAATEPDRAERLAHSITHEPAKVSALCGIAAALAATSW